MCEFCEKHGQGNRWYLNPENFSDSMLEDRKRIKTLEEVSGWGIDYYIDFTSKATQLINWPVIGKAVKSIVPSSLFDPLEEGMLTYWPRWTLLRPGLSRRLQDQPK